MRTRRYKVENVAEYSISPSNDDTKVHYNSCFVLFATQWNYICRFIHHLIKNTTVFIHAKEIKKDEYTLQQQVLYIYSNEK